MRVEIVEVAKSELHLLRELSITTFVHAFASFNSDSNMKAYLDEAFAIEQLDREISNSDSAFYFIRSQNRAAGYLKLNTGSAQNDLQAENGIEVERVYVEADFQGYGLGSKMLEFAINYARNLKKDFMWLGVWEHNQGAIRFYERHGFYQFDRHPFMLGDDRQIDLLFRRDL